MGEDELRQRFQSLRMMQIVIAALFGINAAFTAAHEWSRAQPNGTLLVLDVAAVLTFAFGAYWAYFRNSFDRMRTRMDTQRLANSLKSQIQTCWLLMAVGAFMLTLRLI